jgi:hypothetical protein
VGDSITALTNGNYVVGSKFWNGNIGAATWGSGTAGVTGTVSSANSLVGSSVNDYVGYGITSLTNGNYVVGSYNWNGNRGAATWGSGTAGVTGTVSSANSLVGSSVNDRVGDSIYALTNGNYVVGSRFWNGNIGAATWGSGTAGVTGTVSSANSLVGSSVNDYVGTGIYALTNGNYVVRSSNWNGARGAATWGSGTAGVTGTISSANSLVGSSVNDQVGGSGITALTNGNYVVGSSNWNGARGAATWGSGTAGVTGTVSSANSLVGSSVNDYVGAGGITALTNGNYVIFSSYLNGTTDLAYTLADGTVASSGTVSAANSVIVANPSLDDPSSNSYVQDIPGTGRFLLFFRDTNIAGSAYVASSSLATSGLYTYGYRPEADIALHPDFITGILNAGTAVVLQASNDITVNNNITANNPGGNGGALTLQAGRSILLNANITTDNGNLNLYANEKAATGVVNAYRDAGAAVISMAGGTSINAGTGAVNIRLDDGTGNTNRTSGNITLRDITAGSITAQNVQNTGDVVLNGNLTASAANTAITLASARNFINNTGASALATASGRWLVYSTDRTGTTGEEILANGFNRYGCTYAGGCAGGVTIPGAGNGLIYSYSPQSDVPNTVVRVSQNPVLNMATTFFSASDGGTYGYNSMMGFDSEPSNNEREELASVVGTPSSSVEPEKSPEEKKNDQEGSKKTDQLLKNLQGILTIDPVLAKRLGITSAF